MAIHCESSHNSSRHYSMKISKSTNEPMVAMLPPGLAPGPSHVLPGPDLFSSFHHHYRAAGNAVQYPFHAVLDDNTPDHDEEIDNDRNFHRVEKKRRLTNEQVKSLEVSFDVESKLEPERKSKLAEELGLQPRQVAVWFQNRRARSKTKQLERDYDILKMEYDAVVLEKDKLESEVARLSHLLDSGKCKVASSCHISSMKEHIDISYPPTVQNNPQYHLQEQDDETQEDQALNPITAAHYQHSPSLQSDDARSKQMIIIAHRGSDAGDASSDSDQADAPSCRSTPAEKYIPEQFYHQAAATKPSLAERLNNDPHQLLQQIAVKMEEGFMQVPDLYSSDYFQTYEHEEGDSILCFSWQH